MDSTLPYPTLYGVGCFQSQSICHSLLPNVPLLFVWCLWLKTILCADAIHVSLEICLGDHMAVLSGHKAHFIFTKCKPRQWLEHAKHADSV